MSSHASSEPSRAVSPSTRQMRSISPFIEIKDGKQSFKRESFKRFLANLDIFDLLSYRADLNNITQTASPTIKNEVKKKVETVTALQITFYSLLLFGLIMIIIMKSF